MHKLSNGIEIVPQKVGENCFEMVIKRGLKIFPNGDEAGLKFGPKWDVNVSESALTLADCCLITMETSIREEEGETRDSAVQIQIQ